LAVHFSACLLKAQNIAGPAQSEPGSLFVLDVSVPPVPGSLSRLTFEQAKVQYMGLVLPTPEVQQRDDTMLEILPETGKSGSFQIKFLPFPNASAAEFVLVSGSESRKMTVAFVAVGEEKRDHWHILVGGILLLALAFIFWRYQKKHPGLMSTRSLFLNFEELQKAREQYFPKPSSGSQSPAGSDTAPAIVPVAVEVVTPSSAPDGSRQTNEAGMPEGSVPESRTVEMNVPGANRTLISDTPAVKVAPIAVATPHQDSPGDSSGKTVVRAGLSGKSLASAEPLLHLKLRDGTGREFEARGSEILIGRTNECNILMTAAEVSRKHLLVKREAGKIVAIPQTTSNLTEVNGSRINSAVSINSGDTITLGGTKFTVELGD